MAFLFATMKDDVFWKVILLVSLVIIAVWGLAITIVVFTFLSLGFFFEDNLILPEDESEELYIGSLWNRWKGVQILGEYSELQLLNTGALLYSEKNIEITSEQNIEIFASGDVIIYLPTSFNKNKKIKCILYFCPITKTLKVKTE